VARFMEQKTKYAATGELWPVLRQWMESIKAKTHERLLVPVPVPKPSNPKYHNNFCIFKVKKLQ